MQNYIQQSSRALIVLALSCIVLLLFVLTIGSAVSKPTAHTTLTKQQIEAMLPAVNAENNLPIQVAPEVVTDVNRIYQSAGTRLYLHGVLKRMQSYLPYIKPVLIKNNIPLNFMALPMIETGYKPSTGEIAGMWQITSATAQHLGLIINSKRDDRLNPELDASTAAAYLKELNAEYHDWSLTLVAYNIGTEQTNRLIKATGSHDIWVLARAPGAPAQLKPFLAKFSAAVVIMNNPKLVE